MTSVIDRLGTTGKTCHTWGNISTCSPEVYFEPETYDDVKQILQAASANGKTVRVAGNGFSLNPQAFTSDYLVSLHKLNKVLKVDKDRSQITVEAGASLKDLDENILPELGLGISIHPDVKGIAVGGMCSTGVHGTGKEYKALSNYIVEMKMMLASGEIIEISETTNAELFPAARVSLGVLGIILSATLQCEPGFRLHERVYGAATSTMLDDIDTMAGYADHFRLIIPSENNFERAMGMFVSRNEEMAEGFPFDDSALFQKKSDRSDNIFAPPLDKTWSDMLYIMQWGVARNNMKDATVAFIERIKSLNVGPSVVICKFIHQDDLYLSQAYNRDTANVEVIVLKTPDSSVDKQEFKQKMYAALSPVMAEYGGRPHWAQYFDLTSLDYSKLYPKWQTFRDIRQRLDPAGVFLNTELKQIFL